MNDLKVFENTEFGRIRILENNGEPWFVAKDVCAILEHKNPTVAIQSLDEDERAKLFLGRQGDANCINESGLYALIVRSNKPEAKKFRKWVTSEILPSIRKTGGYQTPQSPMDALKLMVQVAEENRQMIKAVDNDLQEFKKDMPILGIEESRITHAVKKKGVDCLGGKEAPAYGDKSLRGKVYADIYGQLKREFGVNSYKAIKRNQSDKAISIIESYEMPYVLYEQVSEINKQMAI